jgi:hypothetical protein
LEEGLEAHWQRKGRGRYPLPTTRDSIMRLKLISAIPRTSNNRSATSTAPQSQSTVIVDTAGCPLVDNTIYNATTASVTFVKLCSTEILPAAGEEIDMANSVQSSFDSCLDACAAYKGCVAATWFIFSPTDPSQNSVCFLKNGMGVQTPSNSSGTSVVSGYLKTADS